MNLTQKKYVINRIDEIAKSKIFKYLEKYNELTNDYYQNLSLFEIEKFKLLKEGKLKIKKEFQLHTRILDCFIDHSTSPERPERPEIENKKIKEKASQLKDKVMLGNEKTANGALREMENFTIG